MGIVSIAAPGNVGIVQDVAPAELPENAWSDGMNVRFARGSISTVEDSSVLVSTDTDQFTSAIPGTTTEGGFVSWMLGAPTKVSSFISQILTDITRASGPYTATAGDRWSGGVLGGIGILNNGVDAPQAWRKADAAVKLIDLPNWPTGLRAACIRPFKQFLVALDISEGELTHYPTKVLWSHPADPGTVPPSWDVADPTKDAGEYPLSETSGRCVDAVPLRDALIIYKQDSVWAMQLVGGTYIFKFVKLFGDFGIPNRDCAVEFQSGKHFVFTGADIIVHDGQSVSYVASKRVAKRLKSITVAQLKTAYVVANPHEKEVWLCYRQTTDAVVASDMAIVYNWEEGSFSFRKLPNMRLIASGRLDPPAVAVDVWATTVGTWGDRKEAWGEASVIPALTRMLGIGENALYWVGAYQFTTDYAWIERKYLGFPVKATVPPDMSTTKFVRRVWPRFTGVQGTVVNLAFGSAYSVGQQIDWEPSQQFVIGVDSYLDMTLAGKVFAIKIFSEKVPCWTYSGLDADVVPAGE